MRSFLKNPRLRAGSSAAAAAAAAAGRAPSVMKRSDQSRAMAMGDDSASALRRLPRRASAAASRRRGATGASPAERCARTPLGEDRARRTRPAAWTPGGASRRRLGVEPADRDRTATLVRPARRRGRRLGRRSRRCVRALGAERRRRRARAPLARRAEPSRSRRTVAPLRGCRGTPPDRDVALRRRERAARCAWGSRTRDAGSREGRADRRRASAPCDVQRQSNASRHVMRWRRFESGVQRSVESRTRTARALGAEALVEALRAAVVAAR